jgi:hypothetical protein
VVMREVAAGRARAGQGLSGFDVCAAVPSAVVADPAVAHRGIRAELHRYFGLPFYRAMFTQAGYEADIAAYDARPTYMPSALRSATRSSRTSAPSGSRST